MRVVHAADLHIDSPLRGLARLGDDELAHRLRSATRAAVENLVDLVLEQQADVLLLAGDVYDGDWHDYSTGAFFVQQMARLDDAGVPVVSIAGNHDAESEITRSLRLPPNVHVLSTSQPETKVFEDLGLAVHGQGFATRAVLTNLAAGYPSRLPGLVNVGLLHSSVEGAEGHATYAPCSLADLTGLGYEYMALGHVHHRGVLADGEHTVAYSGNVQGRHPRETGPKGAYLVDLAPGAPAVLSPVALDVARWAALEVAVDGLATLDAVLDAVAGHITQAVADAGDRPLVLRLALHGTTPVAGRLADTDHVTEEVRAVSAQLGATVERVRVHVRPPAATDPLDEGLRLRVRSAAQQLRDDPDRVRHLLRPLAAELGPGIREAGLLDLGSTATLQEITSAAAEGLDAMLREGSAS